jgi:hypothetical protein
MSGELVHQKIKIIFSFENAFPGSSIAVFSVCDQILPDIYGVKRK